MTKEELIKSFQDIVKKAAEYFIVHERLNQEESNIYIYGYLATVIDYCRAISNSLELNNTIAIPPVFRSLIEAHVDLINLCQDQDYINVLYYHYLNNKISMLQKTFDEKDNPFFAGPVMSEKEKRKLIKNYRRELEEIRKKIKKYGENATDVSSRFKLAGIAEVHSSIYKLQSQNVHNDISIIEDRHLNKSDNNFSIQLNNKSYVDFAPQIITSVVILKMSIEKVAEVLKWTGIDVLINEIQSIEKQFNEYFKKYYR